MDTKRLLSVAAATCLTMSVVIVGQNEKIKQQASEIQSITEAYTELEADKRALALTLVDTASANIDLQVNYTQATKALKVVRGSSQYYSAEALLYDIPLSKELQQFTYDTCRFYGVDYLTVLAIMWQESNFNSLAVNDAGCYGLMQINIQNLPNLVDKLGITDLLDAQDNIEAGVYLLAGLYNTYGDIDKALMVYNMGDAAAQRQWQRGNYTSAYTRSIHEKEQIISENKKNI